MVECWIVRLAGVELRGRIPSMTRFERGNRRIGSILQPLGGARSVHFQEINCLEGLPLRYNKTPAPILACLDVQGAFSDHAR